MNSENAKLEHLLRERRKAIIRDAPAAKLREHDETIKAFIVEKFAEIAMLQCRENICLNAAKRALDELTVDAK